MDLFASAKAQENQHISTLKAQAKALSWFTLTSIIWGFGKNKSRMKEQTTDMPLLWKIGIFNRKVNIRLALDDDNYQHVQLLMALPLSQQRSTEHLC